MNDQAPLEQDYLLEQLIPELTRRGCRYRKHQPVLARKANPGEIIETLTSTGKETENVAEAGDYVVKNKTGAGEQYIVRHKKFDDRYKLVRRIDNVWSEFSSHGEILAIQVDAKIQSQLAREGSFMIVANWKNTQPVNVGDFLATPLPEKNQIYRIDQREFHETYTLLK